MVCKRFWMLEAQINRIKSEDNLREIAVASSQNGPDSAKSVVDALTLEIGDKYHLTRPTMVKPQSNAGERLRALQGKK